MKKRVIIISGLAFLLLVTIIVGILYFPRSIKNFIGIKFDDIQQIYLEVGIDEFKQYAIKEENKEAFFQEIKKIYIVPTHSQVKSISPITFVIQTKEESYSFCDSYSSSTISSRNNYFLLNEKEYEVLFEFFPNFNYDSYLEKL